MSTPESDADLAERMVRRAIEFACLIREEDRHAVSKWLRELTGRETDGLLIALAAMVPVDTAAAADLLAWVTWDDDYIVPPGPAAVPASLAGQPPRELKPCPSRAAYDRHRAAGEDGEACGCAQAYRDLRKQQHADRKAGQRARREAAGGQAGDRDAA